jgi:hypothetical protein
MNHGQMKKYLFLVFTFGIVLPGEAAQTSNRTSATVDAAKVLPCVERFCRTLAIEVPKPISSNDVTRFRANGGELASLEISKRFQFTVDLKNQLVERFTDRQNSISGKWRATDIKPLIQRHSKITDEEALAMARKNLDELGYSENKLPSLLPPQVQQRWHGQQGAVGAQPLPYFSVEWPWKENPQYKYCEFEIDGFHQKVTQFSIEYPRKNPPPPESPRSIAAGSKEISIVLDTNRVYSGGVEIPVDVRVTNANVIASSVNLLMDGQPTMSIVNPGWISDKPPFSAHWDTTCVTNGWHVLQAFASYPDASPCGYGEYVSFPVQVQTLNEIVFPDFPTTFGTSLPITALLACTNATWTVTVRSDSNQVLQTFSGATTNGRIDVFWDGTDSNGVPTFSGDSIDIDVTVKTSSGRTFSSSW